MKDTFSREITYARISLTENCNLCCQYCMPDGGCSYHTTLLTDDQIEILVQALLDEGIQKIRFTGGEPLMRPGVLQLLERICRNRPQITWAITTNGTTLEQDAAVLRQAGITRVNISLDTLDSVQYHALTGGRFAQAWAGFQAAMEAGFEVRINAVLIRGMSENQIAPLAQLTKAYPVDVRFIELMPIGHCAHWAKQHLLSGKAVLDRLSDLQEAQQDAHAPAHYYKLPNAQGRVGIITPITCDFCSDCNRIRITADGKIKPCLHSDLELDMLPVLHDKQKLHHLLQHAAKQKPERHFLQQNQFTQREMTCIGG